MWISHDLNNIFNLKITQNWAVYFQDFLGLFFFPTFTWMFSFSYIFPIIFNSAVFPHCVPILEDSLTYLFQKFMGCSSLEDLTMDFLPLLLLKRATPLPGLAVLLTSTSITCQWIALVIVGSSYSKALEFPHGFLWFFFFCTQVPMPCCMSFGSMPLFTCFWGVQVEYLFTYFCCKYCPWTFGFAINLLYFSLVFCNIWNVCFHHCCHCPRIPKDTSASCFQMCGYTIFLD